MKTVNELNNRKVPIVTIDDSLATIDTKNTFSDKLEKANEMLKTAKLPKRKIVK